MYIIFLVPEIRKKNFFLLGVGRGVGGRVGGGRGWGEGWGGGWGGGHTCNINFSDVQTIGIVLYGMCSHSLYIKAEN